MARVRYLSVGLAGLIGLLVPTQAQASSGGIASNSFGSNGCNQCHGGGFDPTTTLTGPAVVLGGQTGTFVVSISTPAFQGKGGFNVSAPSGDFSLGGPNAAQTKLIANSTSGRNEVTHSSTKDQTGDDILFSFNWKAPTGACVDVKLTAWGNAVNGIGGATGDRADDTSLTVSNCQPQGGACSANNECKSGFCVDGVCCNEACGGGAADCQACSVAQGAPSNGVCATLPANFTCRGAAGICDKPEVCDGSSKVCPVDTKLKDIECRGAADICDEPDMCDGVGNSCPVDKKVAQGTLCRAGNGLCDPADVCDGTSNVCPDTKLAPGAVCRPAADLCDEPEVCAANGTCPSDVFKPSGATCRAAAGECDVAEKCNGSTATCPADQKLPGGAVCRAAAGGCDAVEKCDGSTNACPADQKLPGGAVCRAAAGGCDVAEKCDGTSLDCPADQKLPSGAVCRAAAGSCDVAEKCDGASLDCPADGYISANTTCRAAAGPCDLAEVCSGSSPQCPNDVLSPAGVVCRPTNGACDVAEKCNGSTATCPADGYADASTSCRSPSCSAGVETKGTNCPGNSPNCPAAVTKPCNPYVCGANACATSCVTASDCAIGSFCAAGACKPRQDNGEACSAGGQCKSNVCVDGVCCDKACNGQCEACDSVGKVGTCSPTTGAPHGSRPACQSDGSLCGGSCNGANTQACTYPNNATSCRAAECASNTATLPASCNGQGACPAKQTQSCGAYGCDGTQCKGDCQLDSDCVGVDQYCSGGICKDQLTNGQACSQDNQCKSSVCADGVCCDKACDGQCEACDSVGKVGTCSPVQGKPHGSRPACQSDGSLCGGSCDGAATQACAYPDVTTSCREGACGDEVATLPATCDGKGSCPAVQTLDCAPYGCDGAKCAGGCLVESDCQLGFACTAGVCTVKKAQGDACNTATECSTDYCVDGVCCDKPCKGQCEACGTEGSKGFCLPVVGEPPAGRPACAGEGPCQGSCDGANAQSCAFPGANILCREPSCADNVATLAASCNGQGACPAKQTQLCTPFSCATTQCAGDCQNDSDCQSGSFCSGGICTSQKALGDACNQAAECGSGQCVDGVCCNAACEGRCQACDLDGKKGTCSTLVDAQPHPGKTPCAGEGACQGTCDGSSATECAFPSTKKLCSPATCEDNLYTGATYCDGVGSCGVAKTSNCGAYGCGLGGCKIECLLDKDCAAGNECSGGACLPIPGAAGAAGASAEGGAAGSGTAAGQAGETGAAGSKAGQGGKGAAAGQSGSGGSGGVSGGSGGKGGAAGATAGAGGAGAAGAPVGDFDPSADGGCGCRAAGTSPASPLAPLALGAFALACARRSRRSRRAA